LLNNLFYAQSSKQSLKIKGKGTRLSQMYCDWDRYTLWWALESSSLVIQQRGWHPAPCKDLSSGLLLQEIRVDILGSLLLHASNHHTKSALLEVMCYHCSVYNTTMPLQEVFSPFGNGDEGIVTFRLRWQFWQLWVLYLLKGSKADVCLFLIQFWSQDAARACLKALQVSQ